MNGPDRHVLRVSTPWGSGVVSEVRTPPGSRVRRGDVIAVVDIGPRSVELRAETDGVVEAATLPGQAVRNGYVVAVIRPEAPAPVTEAWVKRVHALPGEAIRAGTPVLTLRTADGEETVWRAPVDGTLVDVPEEGAAVDPADPPVRIEAAADEGLGIVGRAPAQASTGVETVRLADLGEGVREAVVVEVHVAPGQRVRADDEVLGVETDKAVAAIPAPFDGVVVAVHVKPGDRVAVGEPLFDIARADAVPLPRARGESGTAVTGTARDGSAGVAPPRAEEAEEAARSADRAGRIPAAPAARRLARERGLDLAEVAGSGPGGAVTVADVAGGTGAPTVVPVQRAMREAMERARTVVRADVCDRVVLPDDDPPHGWSAALVLAVARAAAEVPGVVGHFDEDAGVVRSPRDGIDVGVAVAAGSDLFVPVVRGVRVDDDPVEIRARIAALVQRARAGRLRPDDVLPPPHVTVNNFGALGFGATGGMVVVPPQVAVVGLGTIRREPVYVGRTVRVARTASLCVSFDHRAVNGAPVARFASVVAGVVGIHVEKERTT